MNNSNLLSIIVPLFNNENYIKRCILSIINQSYKNIQIIIIDDCSTDEGSNKVKELQNKYNNIKYIKSHKKLGPGGARNKGIKYADGKYITFLDSDDWIDSYAYQKIILSMEEYGSDIGICGVCNETNDPFSSSIRHFYRYNNCIDNIWGLKMLTKEYKTDSIISSLLGNKVFLRNEKFNKIKFIPNNYYEDDIYSFLTIMNSSRISIVSDVYYHYYKNQTSITHQISKKHFKDFIVAFSLLKNNLIKENKFNILEKEFYSFFNKCLAFVLYILIENEQDIVKQKEYLYYFYEQCRKKFDFKTILNHIDTKRILNLFPYSSVL